MPWIFIVIAAFVILLFGVYVSWRAGRLDRMHTRVESARTALDLAMVRRSSSAYELASSGMLDPASSLLLASAVRGAKEAGNGERDLAESDLTRALRATFSQPGLRSDLEGREGAKELLAEVDAAAQQVFIARMFYNDVASRTIDARRRPLARVFRLSGNAPPPEFFEMDDSLGDGTGPG
jgi:hypothetical protein